MAVIVSLTKHILEELVIHNETAEQRRAPFQIKPEIRFQVFPQKEKQPITADINIEIGSMDDNSPIYIKLRMRGMFVATAQSPGDATIDAKDLHKQALVMLFNCARTLIAGATLMGGMAPFNLPPLNPDNLNIQKNN